MKLFYFTFLLASLMSMVKVNASTRVEINGINYNLDDEKLEAEVTKSYNNDAVIVIPSSVQYNEKNYSVTSIGNEAFYKNSRLRSVTIPNSVTSIGYDAFMGCSDLTNIVVETDNTKYDSRDNCNAIIETATDKLIAGCKNTIIPNGVKSIGSMAFNICRGLTSITIPNSVTYIANDAFRGCSGLTSIIIETDNTKYDSRDNCNAIIETATNKLLNGCKNTFIPYGVTSIGNDAFYSCYDLTSITIPNSVTSIGQMAFNGCSKLTTITIPNSVTKIGMSAFAYCWDLTSLTIGNGITSIEGSTFNGCNKLTTVTSLNPIPPTCKAEPFGGGCYSATLQVPIGSKEAYAAADYWKNFANIVEIGAAVLKGDANGDGVVDVADVVAIVNYILNKPGENFNEKAADVNEDGVIDVADVVAVVNIILKGGNANSPEAKAHARAYLKAHGFIVP